MRKALCAQVRGDTGTMVDRDYRNLGFGLLLTVSDQRLLAVTGYIWLWGLR
jgi:hypothetical protein